MIEYRESFRINEKEVKDPLIRFLARTFALGIFAAVMFALIAFFTATMGFIGLIIGGILLVAACLVIPHWALRKLGRRGFFIFGRNDNGCMTVDVDFSGALEPGPPNLKR